LEECTQIISITSGSYYTSGAGDCDSACPAKQQVMRAGSTCYAASGLSARVPLRVWQVDSNSKSATIWLMALLGICNV